MRDNDTQWQLRVVSQRLNRRRFLSGAAVGAGAVGLTIAG